MGNETYIFRIIQTTTICIVNGYKELTQRLALFYKFIAFLKFTAFLRATNHTVTVTCKLKTDSNV